MFSLLKRLFKDGDSPPEKEPAAAETKALPNEDDAEIAAVIAAAVAAYGLQDELEVAAVIAAAVAAYGLNVRQIVSIRLVKGLAWTGAARLEAVHTRNQMF